MEIRKCSGLLACFVLLALVLISGCGGKSTTTAIPTTVTVFYQHGVFFRNHTTMTVGYNAYGQLGDGTTTTRATAAIVPGLGRMAGFAAGANHTLAFYNNSSVMAWGYNSNGQLGNASIVTAATNATSDFSANPVRVGSLTHVTSVAAGAYHSLAVSDGTVWSWGNNTYGQLGVRTVNNVVLGDASTPVEVPNDVNGTFFANAAQVAAGAFHSLAMTTDGKVWAWGDNTYGQLGPNGPAGITTASYAPVQVLFAGSTAKVIQIAASGSYSLALMDDGTVWAWGYNGFGQLGVAATSLISTTGLQASYEPHQVKVIDANGATLFVNQISAGLMHVLARVGDTVWGWGFNEKGQLGNNPRIGAVKDSPDSPNSPVPRQALKGGTSLIGSGAPITGVFDIQAFGNSSLATLNIANPELWGWGENSFGQLGAPIVTSGITYVVLPAKVAGF